MGRPGAGADVVVIRALGAWRRLAAWLFSRRRRPTDSSLQALTAAALSLPGLAQAGADNVGFQYGYYKEGPRQLFGPVSAFKPITVNSLHGGGDFVLTDRLNFGFDFIQDTWGGATPIATAPQDLRGNRSTDGVSGATPYISPGNPLLFDSQFNVLRTNGFGVPTGGISKQLVHTLSSASPETREQGDFRLGYEWNEAALDVGGGLSQERDYESGWGSVIGRFDFNQKLTTLNVGLSYTHSDIAAILDPDALPYINTSAFSRQIRLQPGTGNEILSGVRQDWAAHIGLTQVLTKKSFLETGLGFTRSTGYLENPYKVVEIAFIDPKEDSGFPGTYVGYVRAFLEQRPDARDQWSWDARYVHYVEDWDASLHLAYRFFSDSWGIDAHTFEADWVQPVGTGWMITPRVRYYFQNAADFYVPYLLSLQSVNDIDRAKLPAYFSSDQRLSAFGALSGGVTIEKRLGRGIRLFGDFEYYTHQGGLKWGGGGAGDFTNFNYWQASGTLSLDLDEKYALLGMGEGETAVPGGHHHYHHPIPQPPAGVMFGHMLPQAGDFMIEYRYMFHSQSEPMLRGSHPVNDVTIVTRGCGTYSCTQVATDHTMAMHMLDLMYAPTDWLNLMLMPMFVDMSMDVRRLPTLTGPNVPPPYPEQHVHGGEQDSGGVGDTVMAAFVELLDDPGHHLHLSLGLSAPTGSTRLKFRRSHQIGPTFMHYSMQLGSGTWDFRPSLTYAGQYDVFNWGGQLNGIHRLEDRNDSGYVLGDELQAMAWGGYTMNHWLTASVRGVYTTQGAIRGEFRPRIPISQPMDVPGNYGGSYWDVGFGLSAEVSSGNFQGSRLGVEWLQPVAEDVNGFQLERDGSLFATFTMHF